MSLAEIVRTPTLDELASTANAEHSATFAAVADALNHAILAGDALLSARALVNDGTWGQWLSRNFVATHAVASNYMRIATYKNEILTDGGPCSIKGAIRYLSAIEVPKLARTNGRQPSFDVGEAQRLRAKGLSYEKVADALGVSRSSVHLQIAPGAKQKRHTFNRDWQIRKTAERKILARHERDAVVKKFGGSPADAYALIRKAAQALDRSLAEAASAEQRKEIEQAYAECVKAEAAIVRAVQIGRQS